MRQDTKSKRGHARIPLDPGLRPWPCHASHGSRLLVSCLTVFQLAGYKWEMGSPWSSAQWVGLDNFVAAFSNEQVWASLRTFFILPMMIAPIAVGLVWRCMFDAQFGLINAVLSLISIKAMTWLADPTLAFVAIVIADIWQWTPFVFIMMLAALSAAHRALGCDGYSCICDLEPMAFD